MTPMGSLAERQLFYMKKIKLVYIKGAQVGTRKNQSYPLGAMSIRKYALQDSEIFQNTVIDIEVLDYEVQDEAFVYKIYKEKYDMVLFSSYIWNINRGLEIARKIKLIKKNIYLGLGGPEIDNANDIMMNNEFIDMILIGEGEITLTKVIKFFLLNNKNLKLNGLVYRMGDRLLDMGKADIVHQLDDIPSVIHDDLIKESNLLLYETSRGCPFQCRYCCWANIEIRYYSLDRVERELEELLYMKEGVQLFIIDSELDIDINRAKIIMGFIIKYNIHNKIVQGFLGLHNVDEELLRLCRRANFKFGVGIQTISERALKDIGRSWFKRDIFEKKITILKNYYDFRDIEFQFIMGLPGDNYESFRNNLIWCDNMEVLNITANRLYILPGSYLYKNSTEFNIVYDKNPYHLVYSNYTYSYEDLMKSEALLVAFQVTRNIFENKQCLISPNATIKVWNFIDKLVEIIQSKNLYSQGRQESQVVELEFDFESVMIENLKMLHADYSEFSDFIRMRFCKLKAINFFRENHFKVKENYYDKTVKISQFFISPYVNINNSHINSWKEKHVLFLLNQKTGKLKTIKIMNYIIQNVYKVLEQLKYGIEIVDISNVFKENTYEKVFFDILVKEDIVYYE